MPVDYGHEVVPFQIPGRHFFSHQVNAWDSAVEALDVKRAQFELGDVEPIAMFWAIVDFNPKTKVGLTF